jgi:excisionase family DNA binding protein
MAAIADAPRVYTIEEAKRVFRVSKKVLRRLLEKGEIRGRKVGREWRIPASEIEGYFEAW